MSAAGGSTSISRLFCPRMSGGGTARLASTPSYRKRMSKPTACLDATVGRVGTDTRAKVHTFARNECQTHASRSSPRGSWFLSYP
eukprot:5119951-Lingulodinium_polyedra.AAC.1